MLLLGIELLESIIEQSGFSAKMVFNDNGAIFLPTSSQHRDHKAPGISYEDDYAGNALAAMLYPGRVEVRYHRDYPDEHVARILGNLVSEPRLSGMRDWQATYQGRPLRLTP